MFPPLLFLLLLRLFSLFLILQQQLWFIFVLLHGVVSQGSIFRLSSEEENTVQGFFVIRNYGENPLVRFNGGVHFVFIFMIPRHSYQSLTEVFSGIFVIPVDCESRLEILHRLVKTSIVCIKSPASHETFHVIIVNVQGLVEALERFHVITGFEILDT